MQTSSILEQQVYTLYKKIVDDLFDIDHLHHYTLSIQVSQFHFKFCITDSINKRCMLVEDYIFDNPLSAIDYTKQLELLYEDHWLLKAGFWKSIKLSVKNLKFSLVPASLFDAEYAPDYLNFVSEIDKSDELYHFKHSSNDMVNVFVAEKHITDWFKSKYPGKNLEIFHHTSLFIEALLQNNAKYTDRTMHVNVEVGMITIVVKNGHHIEFCNSYKYKTANDLLYFVMFAFDELNLDANILPLILTGNIKEESEHVEKLSKYIRFVNFSNRTQTLKFGYKFDEIADHNYFDLYSLHLCHA